MLSMTGYSRAEAQDKGIKAVVEIKSLNGRFLEINCRLPKNLNPKELEIKEIIKSNISRGSISVNISIEYEHFAKSLNLDPQNILQVYNELKNIKKITKVKEDISLSHILHFSSLLNQQKNDDNTELEWKLVKSALSTCLKSLNKMRIAEGQNLLKDIRNRIKKINQLLEKIQDLGEKRIPKERERLRQQVAKLFESDEIDESRIQFEIVLLANKLDISEECVRLHSHIKFFNEILKSKEPIGQKINFLLQEMTREINTIGSKADDSQISHHVVEIKEELERIREQIQNIE